MPKVSQEDLKDFGAAVKRARTLKGWTLDQLGAELEPPVGKSFLSKIEKGQKENLSARSVGRLITALNLDQGWIDVFLDVETMGDDDETSVEREADRILDRLSRDTGVPEASEELLILLANRYAEGTHRDLQTAYVGVRTALEEFAAMKARQDMPDNADGQFQALMATVTRLNEAGEVDAAGDALDDAMARVEAERDTVFQKQLSQDRVRNRPDLAAERLIKDQYRQAPPGGVFWAVDRLCYEWLDRGDREGDMFALQVALEMAKANHAKAKKALHAFSLHTMAIGHWRIGERSVNPRHLTVARNAEEGALKHRSKKRDPQNWAASQGTLGSILSDIAERDGDPVQMQRAVDVHRDALKVRLKHGTDHQIATTWNNLGNALQSLGELTQQPEPVREAISCFENALALYDPQADKETRGDMLNNLGLAWRWLGALTGDLAALDTAARHYADCMPFRPRETAAFKWAMTQWNLGDLALTRYELTKDPALLATARSHVMDARAVFVEGSDHQTERCDALLARIDAAKPD